MKFIKIAGIFFVIGFVAFFVRARISPGESKPLGISTTGKFQPCPESPNCVSSTEDSKGDHFIRPLKYEFPLDEALRRMKGILKKDAAQIISEKENYIHAIYTTSLFGFVDDVEIFWGESGKIHLRSLSRKGYSDLGTNRKRLEMIKFHFDQNDF